jgi:hypothetical protein
MSTTRTFIETRLQQAERPGLDLALLTDRGMRYAGSRLWFVYLRALLRTAVYAAELWFLMRAFPLEFAIPLFTMRTAVGIWGSAWWGLLEGVRRRVRDHAYARADLARIAIEAWTCIAIGIGSAVLGMGVWVVSRADDIAWRADGLYGSYLLASGFVLLVDMWTRTLHSGAFALGRVYRSGWSMLLPDVLELALIVVWFRSIGPFALAASLLATTLFRTSATLYYLRKAYRSRKLLWPGFLRLRSLASLDLRDLGRAARGALSSVPGQLDRVLLVLLMGAGPPAPEILPLAAPYYALRPIAAVAQGWARTYYVDLVRMDSLAATLLRARLERMLRRTAMIAGGVASTTLVVGGLLLFGEAGMAAGWLVPLTLLRAYFSVLQIRALAYARTDALAALAALMGLVVGAAWVVDAPDRSLVALVTLLLALAAVLSFWVQHRAGAPIAPRRTRVPLGTWLAELSAHPEPVRLHVACTVPRLAKASNVLHQLQIAGAARRSARFGDTWLLWWEDGRKPLPASEIARVLSGTCRVHAQHDASSGMDAIVQASAASVLPDELRRALCDSELPASARELRARVERELPTVYVIDAEHASPGLAQLSPAELRLIHRALIAVALERRTVPRKAPWQCAVYAPRGQPSLAFVWPAHASGMGEMRRYVVHAGWQASLPRKLASPTG